MHRTLALFLALAGPSSLASCAADRAGERGADLAPVELRCESLAQPLGIDVATPRFSWQLAPRDERLHGLRQGAWRVLVGTDAAELARERAELWDSGRVDDSRSIQIEYAGRPLPSLTRCWWTVQVWDQAGRASAPSAPSSSRCSRRHRPRSSRASARRWPS